MMTLEEKYEYWLDIAQYDLATADSLFASGRWLYVVFMCEQAIEKLVKGLYLFYVDDKTPHIHNIENIILRFADKLPEPISEDKHELFEQLSMYYLEARYPEYKEKLSTLTDKEMAEKLLKQTKEVFQWLLTMKPSKGE
jgi:HEPN domain-containing protein